MERDEPRNRINVRTSVDDAQFSLLVFVLLQIFDAGDLVRGRFITQTPDAQRTADTGMRRHRGKSARGKLQVHRAHDAERAVRYCGTDHPCMVPTAQ